MTIRFFILQAHYRSTVDFSNEALQASEKGYGRLMDICKRLQELKPSETSTINIGDLRQKCFDAMNDDLNTPIVISHLFEAGKAINSIFDGNAGITAADLQELRDVYALFVNEILGLIPNRNLDRTMQTLRQNVQLTGPPSICCWSSAWKPKPTKTGKKPIRYANSSRTWVSK
jgi:cysteinyl-tRNA synthetase